MFNKSFFSRLLRVKRSDSVGSKKGEAKTTFYRSHYIKKHPDSDDVWECKISGKVVAGSLENVKKSINTWYETKIVIPPAHFDVLPDRASDRQIVEYKGFKIINDKGGEKDWYLTYKGKLLKGSKAAIEKRIDQAFQRAQSKKDNMVKKSLEMAQVLEKGKTP